MTSILASLGYGLTLPLRTALVIVRRPKLIFLSALPVLMTALLYTAILAPLIGHSRDGIMQMSGWIGWQPQGVMAGALVVLASILIFAGAALTFSIASGFIATPFNDFLAEAAESSATPPLPPAPRQTVLMKLWFLVIDLMKAFIAGMGMLASLVFGWIPIVNLFAFVLACLMITFQYISYPQTRRSEGVREGFRFVRRHFFACTAFGGVMAFLFSTPPLSFFAMPIAVVGGTLLYGRARGGPDLPPLR